MCYETKWNLRIFSERAEIYICQSEVKRHGGRQTNAGYLELSATTPNLMGNRVINSAD